uniref:DYW domain-containing protein n=1 Tax=Arcella intermedia TaxID=1963864 RepID=A0A6B2L732_9EUKA
MNCMIHMFSKCGDFNTAKLIFERIKMKNCETWNIMILSLAEHGYGVSCVEYLNKMIETTIKPDTHTFVSVLNGLSHVGKVEEGISIYNKMQSHYNIQPTYYHKTCIVDLLSRNGRLNEAEKFIQNQIEEPDITIWKTLLSSCRNFLDVERAERIAQNIFNLNDKDESTYVLLGNIYASLGMSEKLNNIRQLMVKKGIKKTPGETWGMVNGKMVTFMANDDRHPEHQKIFLHSKQLDDHIIKMGFKHNFIFAIDKKLNTEEDKIRNLCSHSERLFISYALLNNHSPIVAYKNLRMCQNCHEATKYISKLTKTHLQIRDNSRWHHFVDGKCSCNDYY